MPANKIIKQTVAEFYGTFDSVNLPLGGRQLTTGVISVIQNPDVPSVITFNTNTNQTIFDLNFLLDFPLLSVLGLQPIPTSIYETGSYQVNGQDLIANVTGVGTSAGSSPFAGTKTFPVVQWKVTSPLDTSVFLGEIESEVVTIVPPSGEQVQTKGTGKAIVTIKLLKIADDVFKISNSSGKSKIKVTLTERSSNLVNELGVFTVDDAQGKINGIAPGTAGYAQAALERSKVIFSAIANLPNGFNTDNLTHLLEFNSGDNLRFYLVKNSTTDAVMAGVTPFTDILFSDSLTQKITDLGNDDFSLAWKDGSGNNATDFNNLVVKFSPTNDSLPLGTNLQGKPQGEVIDLRGITSQVKADFVVNREAAFNNFIGFYQVTDENGGIDSNGDGKADIFAGQPGYVEAAVRGRVAGIDLTVNNQGTATYTGTFQPGSIFVPFIIVNDRPDALLDSNPNNNPAVYFPFLGANADKVDHIRLLGNNVFGFEDLPNGGDKDFNDVILRVNMNIV